MKLRDWILAALLTILLIFLFALSTEVIQQQKEFQNQIAVQQEEIEKIKQAFEQKLEEQRKGFLVELQNLEDQLNQKWNDKEYVDNRIEELGSMIKVIEDMTGKAQERDDNC